MTSRLPPQVPQDLDPEQRELNDRVSHDVGQSLQGFRTHDERGALVGPFTAMVQYPKLGNPLWAYTEAVGGFGSLPPRVREVVILTTGAHFRAAYELYAHAAMGKIKGLSDEQVKALAAGQTPQDLEAPEATAREVTAALLAGGPLSGELYQKALDAFGAPGVAELAQLTGVYCLVSLMLNTYDVPVPQE